MSLLRVQIDFSIGFPVYVCLMCNSCWDTYETRSFSAVCDSPRARDRHRTNVARRQLFPTSLTWETRSLHWSSRFSRYYTQSLFGSFCVDCWANKLNGVGRASNTFARCAAAAEANNNKTSSLFVVVVVGKLIYYYMSKLRVSYWFSAAAVSTPSWLDWNWISRNQRHRIISYSQRCAMLK